MTRAIYLVANKKSENLCANLVYSIRQSGCKLPIVLIPFGGKPVDDPFIIKEVELLELDDFPKEAHNFINDLGKILTCSEGFLRRFLVYFGPYDEFLYSDNDVVALMNWEKMFDLFEDYDLLNADEEYKMHGRFNFENPNYIQDFFGQNALESAITAGHFLSRKSSKLISDLLTSSEWIKEHKEICKTHDQTLLHVAILIGNWNCLNLCKAPNNWLSSWVGSYKNSLSVIQAIQSSKKVSHLHYSGRSPINMEYPIDELLFSHLPVSHRNQELLISLLRDITLFNKLNFFRRRMKGRIIEMISKS